MLVRVRPSDLVMISGSGGSDAAWQCSTNRYRAVVGTGFPTAVAGRANPPEGIRQLSHCEGSSFGPLPSAPASGDILAGAVADRSAGVDRGSWSWSLPVPLALSTSSL